MQRKAGGIRRRGQLGQPCRACIHARSSWIDGNGEREDPLFTISRRSRGLVDLAFRYIRSARDTPDRDGQSYLRRERC